MGPGSIGRVGQVGQVGQVGRPAPALLGPPTSSLSSPPLPGSGAPPDLPAGRAKGSRHHNGGAGSREGYPLHSHRSSRDSGEDLWEGQCLDLDPARVSHFSATPRGRGCMRRLIHGSSGLRPSTCGYEAGTHKGCNPGPALSTDSGFRGNDLFPGGERSR